MLVCGFGPCSSPEICFPWKKNLRTCAQSFLWLEMWPSGVTTYSTSLFYLKLWRLQIQRFILKVDLPWKMLGLAVDIWGSKMKLTDLREAWEIHQFRLSNMTTKIVLCDHWHQFPYILLQVHVYFVAMHCIATFACVRALNVCAFIISYLRPHHILDSCARCRRDWCSRLVTFSIHSTTVRGISNICVWGGTARCHRNMEVSDTLLHKSFERETTLVD